MVISCIFGFHDWSKDCEKCFKCTQTRKDQHSWEGCKCIKCGRIRNEGHDWSRDCEICAHCGRTHPNSHVWQDHKCTVCGRMEPITPSELCQRRIVISLSEYPRYPLASIQQCLLTPDVARIYGYDVMVGGTRSEVAAFVMGVMDRELAEYNSDLDVDKIRIDRRSRAVSSQSGSVDIQAMAVECDLATEETHYGYNKKVCTRWIFNAVSNAVGDFDCIVAAQRKDIPDNIAVPAMKRVPLVGVKDFIKKQKKRPLLEISEKLVAQILDSAISNTFRVSPDSNRVAYVAQRGNQWSVVVGGNEGKQFDGIIDERFFHNLFFSPDSKRVAYRAKTGNQWCFVVDGMEGKQYDDVQQPIFSPDSKRVAYETRTGNKWRVVVDGMEGKQYDFISELIFSPDSKRVAYRGKTGEKWCVVVDGKEGKQYGFISELIFSPDSKRVAYVAKRGSKCFVVVDGNEGKQYELFSESRVMFDSSESLHCLMVRGGSVYLVTINTSAPEPAK
jgi:hypothetical protein